MIDIVDPRGEKAGIEASSVEINWPNGFVGQRVGFFGNGKSNVEGFFRKWAEQTLDQGAVDTLILMKEGPMARGGVERYQRFKENTDIVIVGVCDGGTAASQGAIDAAALANLGVPTIMLCTDAFVGLAKILLPDSCDGVKVLVIPHPLSSLTSTQTTDLAKRTFPDVKLLLSDGLGASVDQCQGKVSSAQDLSELAQYCTEVKGADFDYRSSGLMHELGLSDGLPVFLPTKERVNKILDFWPTSLLYDSTLFVPPRNGLATPAAIAANAVMSGMPPNIAPYAAAATHALCNPNFQVFNLQTTTNPVTPVIVVGGPSTEKNGFNNKLGALGSGNVNNASLGRTLKLCMRNIGGASAESGVDPATIGQPGKYTFCFAELEGVVHWPPLRSQTKNALGTNHDAVTLVGVTGTANMIIKATSAQELIEMIAKSIRSVGSNDYMFGGSPLLVLCPEHAQIFENEKISIQEVKKSLFEMTKLKFSEFAPKNQEMMRTPRLGDLGMLTPDSDVPMTKNADSFLVCVAGGASLHSTFMPSFGGSTPVSHAVELGA
ncbi:hypothetical protein OBB02_01200 [Candidatus Puniceispirillum sp.]|nr:hypothetical protein [Candidatus Puniceispirillum sp.]